MSRHLFLLTVTPVQSFILAARKTQDLYAGSHILSHFCRTVISRAKSRYQAEIVFPSEKIQSLPNRVLAVFETDGGEDQLNRIGWDLEQAIRDELSAMTEKVLHQLQLQPHEQLLRQLEQYFQVHWTFYPLDGHTYAEAYRQIEAAMGSIKNVRAFVQLSESGRKCTVTGEHNALYYREDGSGRKIGHAIPIPERIPTKYFAPGEALGGIALLKRCTDQYFGGEFNSSFPSTSRIALMDALYRLGEMDPEYRDILDDDFDEQDIFRLHNHEQPLSGPNAERVYKRLKNLQIGFTPYYAALQFDGDSMGAWLSGTKLDRQADPDSLRRFHSRLSEELGKFAKIAAEEIVVPPRGITVYAGGDDFLGFVNLAHLLQVMKELREQFERVIDLSEFTDQRLTFSAGVAIAHFKTPLAEVLNWARKMMDEEAKKLDSEKDAFGIALLRHSGEISRTVYKWKTEDSWTADLLDRLVNRLKQDFSSSFIRTFRFEFRPLMNESGELDPAYVTDEMVEKELKRLIERTECKRPNLPEECKQKAVEEVMDILNKLYLAGRSFDHFVSLLDLAAFMEREMVLDA